MDYMNYITPEQAQKLAETGNPDDQINALGGVQGFANGMGMRNLRERDNGRVVGVTSPLEAIGGAAQQISGAAMQGMLANKYGDILKQGNKNRGLAAKDIVNALRGNQPGALPTDANGFPTDAAGNIQFDY